MPSLWRSTPFRLMIVLGGAFVVFLVLAGFVAYQLIQTELDSRLRRQLEQTFSVIAQSYGKNDITDLTETVQSNATSNPGHERVFLLRDAAGKFLAGNVAIAPSVANGTLVAPESFGLPAGGEMYHAYAGTVGGNTLIVGASQSEVEDIGAIVLSSLGWTGLVFLIISFAAALILAVQGQKRLDGIGQTMRRFGRGDLSARIATNGNDDIDDLARQVNQALDRLSALVESLRQVSVDIAHDLKTPLNRLSLIVQDAVAEDAAGRPVKALLMEAEAECHQIGATFDALLRIAQIEAGSRRTRFKEVDIAELFDRLRDAYSEVAEENGQSLSFTVADRLPTTRGDKDLLLQLLVNLIENAIRHCPRDTLIAVSARTAGHALELVVADNGPGIPAADREKVFQRLYRLDKSRSTPGNGLGLSLVRAVADLHQASVSIEDNNPGVRFVVLIPLDEAVVADLITPLRR